MSDHDDDFAVTTQQFQALGQKLDEAKEAAKRDILLGTFAKAAKAIDESDDTAASEEDGEPGA